MDRLRDVLLLCCCCALAFVIGDRANSARLEAERAHAEARESANEAASRSTSLTTMPRPKASISLPQGKRKPKTPPTKSGPLLIEGGSGSSATANDMIAVTGSYGVGTSVLYLVDTKTKQLAVYEARGGSRNSRRLVLVGARRIDLDLQLEGYNDESDFSFAELQKRFRARGIAPATGDTDKSGSGKAETGK